MTQGVALESHESQEIKDLIVGFMAAGVGTTFTAAIQHATSRELNGVVTPYARVSEREVYRWREEDKIFNKSIDEARKVGNSKIVDLAQSKLVKRISDDTDIKEQGRMIRFALERLGKDIGYAPRQEHTGADGAALRGLDSKLPLATPEEEAQAALALLQSRE